MSITIKLFAALREAGESELQLELAEISSDATPADVAAVKAALANRGTESREAPPAQPCPRFESQGRIH